LTKKRCEREAAEQPSFEEAIEQLEQIVRLLEEGEVGLNEALEQYEKGVKLLRRCYGLVQGAERQIELLSGVDAEGNPLSVPLGDPAAGQKKGGPARRSSGDDLAHPS